MRHRNRHRAMCVCVGKLLPDRPGRLPLQWLGRTRDSRRKILIGLEDSPCFTVWILFLSRGSEIRLCGLTENSFIFQGKADISQTHSLN